MRESCLFLYKEPLLTLNYSSIPPKTLIPISPPFYYPVSFAVRNFWILRWATIHSQLPTFAGRFLGSPEATSEADRDRTQPFASCEVWALDVVSTILLVEHAEKPVSIPHGNRSFERSMGKRATVHAGPTFQIGRTFDSIAPSCVTGCSKLDISA